MSSKKLMAAALAAVMAVGTVSTVAFATEGVDTWTIDGTKAGDLASSEATINPYFAISLNDLPTTMKAEFATAGIKNGSKNDGNDYNKELNLALWESYEKKVTAGGVTTTTKLYQFKDFKGGTATLSMEGSAVKWVPAKVVIGTGTSKDVEKLADTGTVTGIPKVMVPELKDGAVVVLTTLTGIKEGDITAQASTVGYKIATKEEVAKYDATDDTTKTVTLAGAETNVGASNTTKVYSDANGDLVFGNSNTATTKVATTKATGKQTVNIGAALRDVAGPNPSDTTEAATFGKQTGTVQFTPSFDGLGDTLRLASIDLTKSSITIDVSGTVTGATWDKYYLNAQRQPLWSLEGSKDYPWVWKASDGQFGDSNPGIDGLCVLIGYKDSLGYAASTPRTLKTNPDVKEDNKDLSIPNVLTWTPVSGSGINLGFGDLVPPAVLKALNDGGTITFEFSRELKGTEYFTGVMMFGYNNNSIANNVAIEPTYGNGKTATVEIPAGLTYYKDEKNPWQSVGLGWNFSFEKLGQGLFGTAATEDKAVTDVKIVKMTFAAKGATVGTTSGSATTSGGNAGNTSASNTNPNGNPPTGVALAVAPVILAAGAVISISASKKRK